MKGMAEIRFTSEKEMNKKSVRELNDAKIWNLLHVVKISTHVASARALPTSHYDETTLEQGQRDLHRYRSMTSLLLSFNDGQLENMVRK